MRTALLEAPAYLTVQPDDRTPTHTQIWLPVSAPDAQLNVATIRVKAPFDMDEGVIETQPDIATSILEPWGNDNATLGQATENTLAFQRRRARFE